MQILMIIYGKLLSIATPLSLLAGFVLAIGYSRMREIAICDALTLMSIGIGAGSLAVYYYFR